MRIVTSFDKVETLLQSSLEDVTGFAISACDVMAIDVENIGTGAVTGFEVHGRINRDAPYRNITPSSFTTQSYEVLDAAVVSPLTLAAGAFSQFALNVSTLESVKIRASGSTATLKIYAAGYSD